MTRQSVWIDRKKESAVIDVLNYAALHPYCSKSQAAVAGAQGISHYFGMSVVNMLLRVGLLEAECPSRRYELLIPEELADLIG
jgi:hypothetical protein